MRPIDQIENELNQAIQQLDEIKATYDQKIEVYGPKFDEMQAEIERIEGDIAIFSRKHGRKNRQIVAELTAEKEALVSAQENLGMDNPEIIDLIQRYNSIEEKAVALQEELDEAEAAERRVAVENLIYQKLGTNILIVAMDSECQCWYKFGALTDAKALSITSHLNLDGANRGSVGRPFIIIPLFPGLHSISVRFSTAARFHIYRDYYWPVPYDGEFETENTQFTVNGTVKFISYNELVIAETLHFQENVFDNYLDFIEANNISEEDFINYIQRL